MQPKSATWSVKSTSKGNNNKAIKHLQPKTLDDIKQRWMEIRLIQTVKPVRVTNKVCINWRRSYNTEYVAIYLLNKEHNK